ncbi:uncharacterized protein [Asterias amurensis]|uniref:uncharacterized protein n=1 Tax=Asterias amurensis TaxID=7602 RepID=UPI003AB304EF
MGSTELTLFLCCLGAFICICQSSTCSHAQCVYDYVTAKADCSSLNLDCIPVNYPDALIMDLSHNNISELSQDDFNGTFSRLAELYLDHNNISDVMSLLGSNELESLQILSVKHNLISYWYYYNACQLSSLIELSVDYNSITYMYMNINTRSSCRKLQRFSADFNLIKNAYVYLYKLSNIVISLQYNRLNSVDGWFQHGENASLLLDHNEIRYLHFPIYNNHIADTISLNHNQLQSVYVYIGATYTFNVGSNGLANWNGTNIRDYYAMKRMDMSNNSFDSLIQPPWAEALEFLNADTNLLANLSSTTLSGFVDLTELHVANNRLLFISPTALSQLSMLQSLYLDDNDLTSLFGGVFSNQSYLVELSITNNRLTMLHPDYFMGLVSLERLYLAGNQLTSVNAQMFQMVLEILTLDLSQNELQLVDLHDCALHLTNLQNLSLPHNKIHDTNTILGFCDNLQVLDMSYNLIQVVPGDSLSGRNRALSQLELEGNPLQCDCRLTGLRDWLRNNQPHVEPRCEGPNHNYGSVISDLEIYDLSCQPPMAMVDIKQLTALDGQSVTLKCTATGIPAPNVTWLSPNDTEITHDWQGRFTILQGTILHIIPVEKHDQGRYTCLVQNILGEKSRAVVNLTVTNSTKSDAPQPQPQPNSLASSVLPTMFISIIITVAVIAVIIFLRRYRKKHHSRAANSTSATKTSHLKVGFRKGGTADSERGCVNKVLDEDYEIPNEQQAPQQTTRYANSPATGRRQPSPTHAQTYEDPSGGNGDSKGDEEVYESVSDPYF